MSVKEDLNEKMERAREDAIKAGTPPADVDGVSLNLKDHPGAKAIAHTRNGAVLVTY